MCSLSLRSSFEFVCGILITNSRKFEASDAKAVWFVNEILNKLELKSLLVTNNLFFQLFFSPRIICLCKHYAVFCLSEISSG